MGHPPVTRSEATVGVLRDRGAAALDHPGGDLLTHLQRTSALLRDWGAEEALWLAGLGHAAYGTDGFRVALFDLSERDAVRSLIGTDAESIVYTYCACDRDRTYARLDESPLRLGDRFTGTDLDLTAAEASDFATLSIANELDIVREGALEPAAVASITRMFRALLPFAPDAAERALAEGDRRA
jgi:hypothetical protein